MTERLLTERWRSTTAESTNNLVGAPCLIFLPVIFLSSRVRGCWMMLSRLYKPIRSVSLIEAAALMRLVNDSIARRREFRLTEIDSLLYGNTIVAE
jgi:hypothetical protein